MNNLIITHGRQVTRADAESSRLGTRFGRLDTLSQLAVVAVECLGIKFDQMALDRIGICLVARAGSLSTDVEFWNGRDAVGGPSPTLFAYTLPSAAIGEIAIRYQLRGPNVCLVGNPSQALTEGVDLVSGGEVGACVCVGCDALTPEAATLTGSLAADHACAWFVASPGFNGVAVRRNDP
jgi:3-oxoacyl-(acyl-carrier-protein) synthase